MSGGQALETRCKYETVRAKWAFKCKKKTIKKMWNWFMWRHKIKLHIFPLQSPSSLKILEDW